MIPQDTSLIFEAALDHAEELADNGHAIAGYRCLDLNLAWAERNASESWGEQLIEKSRRALVEFAERYAIAWTYPGDDVDGMFLRH